MDLFLLKIHNGFITTTSQGLEDIAKYKIGTTYKVKISMPRNYEFHKKFFSFVRFCFFHKPETMDTIQTEEHMRQYIQYGIGHYNVLITPDGEQLLTPKSISFGSMDNVAFQDFYDRCTTFACKHILLGLTTEQIEKELINFI